jgi:hypothetical protein
MALSVHSEQPVTLAAMAKITGTVRQLPLVDPNPVGTTDLLVQLGLRATRVVNQVLIGMVN